MQYWKPAEPYSVGDAMPFWSRGTYHLIYLLDEGHHSRFEGLGGHIWAHASSEDLIHWQPHPLAVPLGEPGACDQYGICTGSVFEHEGVYYAFYATRTLDSGALADRQERRVTERLCLSTSHDGIHFTKSPSNPFLSPPPGYAPGHWRDPFVFREEATGEFHLLVTACLDPAPIAGRGGCLAHFVSRDLEHWELREPFLGPGLPEVPECPDYFEWNGWYYLTFLQGGWARYRMSREPLGPWTCPAVDTYDGPGVFAMKTAAFGEGRRIGAGFVPWRQEGRDDGGQQYAGNLVFRELIQHPDGTLGSRFPAELVPTTAPPAPPRFHGLTAGVQADRPGLARVDGRAGFALALAEGIPADARITLRLVPEAGVTDFGVALRGVGAYAQGYELRCTPALRRVRLSRLDRRAAVEDLGFTGLDRPFTLDVVMKGDLIDLCLDGRRCLLARFPEVRGNRLFLFAENGAALFQDVRVAGLAG
ncbi:MAG: hypothetical protein GX774_15740 [Armatimonadetes bacterium]|nr:hypothetical protein [Armatimonadota bacterium]